MALWKVRIDATIGRPGLLGPTFERLEVLAFTTRFLGDNIALIDATDAEIAPLRSLKGIELVEKAIDELYYDDRTRTKFAVMGDGTWYRHTRY